MNLISRGKSRNPLCLSMYRLHAIVRGALLSIVLAFCLSSTPVHQNSCGSSQSVTEIQCRSFSIIARVNASYSDTVTIDTSIDNPHAPGDNSFGGTSHNKGKLELPDETLLNKKNPTDTSHPMQIKAFLDKAPDTLDSNVQGKLGLNGDIAPSDFRASAQDSGGVFHKDGEEEKRGKSEKDKVVYSTIGENTREDIQSKSTRKGQTSNEATSNDGVDHSDPAEDPSQRKILDPASNFIHSGEKNITDQSNSPVPAINDVGSGRKKNDGAHDIVGNRKTSDIEGNDSRIVKISDDLPDDPDSLADDQNITAQSNNPASPVKDVGNEQKSIDGTRDMIDSRKTNEAEYHDSRIVKISDDLPDDPDLLVDDQNIAAQSNNPGPAVNNIGIEQKKIDGAHNIADNRKANEIEHRDSGVVKISDDLPDDPDLLVDDWNITTQSSNPLSAVSDVGSEQKRNDGAHDIVDNTKANEVEYRDSGIVKISDDLPDDPDLLVDDWSITTQSSNPLSAVSDVESEQKKNDGAHDIVDNRKANEVEYRDSGIVKISDDLPDDPDSPIDDPTPTDIGKLKSTDSILHPGTLLSQNGDVSGKEKRIPPQVSPRPVKSPPAITPERKLDRDNDNLNKTDNNKSYPIIDDIGASANPLDPKKSGRDSHSVLELRDGPPSNQHGDGISDRKQENTYIGDIPQLAKHPEQSLQRTKKELPIPPVVSEGSNDGKPLGKSNRDPTVNPERNNTGTSSSSIYHLGDKHKYKFSFTNEEDRDKILAIMNIPVKADSSKDPNATHTPPLDKKNSNSENTVSAIPSSGKKVSHLKDAVSPISSDGKIDDSEKAPNITLTNMGSSNSRNSVSLAPPNAKADGLERTADTMPNSVEASNPKDIMNISIIPSSKKTPNSKGGMSISASTMKIDHSGSHLTIINSDVKLDGPRDKIKGENSNKKDGGAGSSINITNSGARTLNSKNDIGSKVAVTEVTDPKFDAQNGNKLSNIWNKDINIHDNPDTFKVNMFKVKGDNELDDDKASTFNKVNYPDKHQILGEKVGSSGGERILLGKKDKISNPDLIKDKSESTFNETLNTNSSRRSKSRTILKKTRGNDSNVRNNNGVKGIINSVNKDVANIPILEQRTNRLDIEPDELQHNESYNSDVFPDPDEHQMLDKKVGSSEGGHISLGKKDEISKIDLIKDKSVTILNEALDSGSSIKNKKKYVKGSIKPVNSGVNISIPERRIDRFDIKPGGLQYSESHSSSISPGPDKHRILDEKAGSSEGEHISLGENDEISKTDLIKDKSVTILNETLDSGSGIKNKKKYVKGSIKPVNSGVNIFIPGRRIDRFDIKPGGLQYSESHSSSISPGPDKHRILDEKVGSSGGEHISLGENDEISETDLIKDKRVSTSNDILNTNSRKGKNISILKETPKSDSIIKNKKKGVEGSIEPMDRGVDNSIPKQRTNTLDIKPDESQRSKSHNSDIFLDSNTTDNNIDAIPNFDDYQIVYESNPKAGKTDDKLPERDNTLPLPFDHENNFILDNSIPPPSDNRKHRLLASDGSNQKDVSHETAENHDNTTHGTSPRDDNRGQVKLDITSSSQSEIVPLIQVNPLPQSAPVSSTNDEPSKHESEVFSFEEPKHKDKGQGNAALEPATVRVTTPHTVVSPDPQPHPDLQSDIVSSAPISSHLQPPIVSDVSTPSGSLARSSGQSDTVSTAPVSSHQQPHIASIIPDISRPRSRSGRKLTAPTSSVEVPDSQQQPIERENTSPIVNLPPPPEVSAINDDSHEGLRGSTLDQQPLGGNETSISPTNPEAPTLQPRPSGRKSTNPAASIPSSKADTTNDNDERPTGTVSSARETPVVPPQPEHEPQNNGTSNQKLESLSASGNASRHSLPDTSLSTPINSTNTGSSLSPQLRTGPPVIENSLPFQPQSEPLGIGGSLPPQPQGRTSAVGDSPSPEPQGRAPVIGNSLSTIPEIKGHGNGNTTLPDSPNNFGDTLSYQPRGEGHKHSGVDEGPSNTPPPLIGKINNALPKYGENNTSTSMGNIPLNSPSVSYPAKNTTGDINANNRQSSGIKDSHVTTTGFRGKESPSASKVPTNSKLYTPPSQNPTDKPNILAADIKNNKNPGGSTEKPGVQAVDTGSNKDVSRGDEDNIRNGKLPNASKAPTGNGRLAPAQNLAEKSDKQATNTENNRSAIRGNPSLTPRISDNVPAAAENSVLYKTAEPVINKLSEKKTVSHGPEDSGSDGSVDQHLPPPTSANEQPVKNTPELPINSFVSASDHAKGKLESAIPSIFPFNTKIGPQPVLLLLIVCVAATVTFTGIVYYFKDNAGGIPGELQDKSAEDAEVEDEESDSEDINSQTDDDINPFSPPVIIYTKRDSDSSTPESPILIPDTHSAEYHPDYLSAPFTNRPSSPSAEERSRLTPSSLRIANDSPTIGLYDVVRAFSRPRRYVQRARNPLNGEAVCRCDISRGSLSLPGLNMDAGRMKMPVKLLSGMAVTPPKECSSGSSSHKLLKSAVVGNTLHYTRDSDMSLEYNNDLNVECDTLTSCSTGTSNNASSSVITHRCHSGSCITGSSDGSRSRAGAATSRDSSTMKSTVARTGICRYCGADCFITRSTLSSQSGISITSSSTHHPTGRRNNLLQTYPTRPTDQISNDDNSSAYAVFMVTPPKADFPPSSDGLFMTPNPAAVFSISLGRCSDFCSDSNSSSNREAHLV